MGRFTPLILILVSFVCYYLIDGEKGSHFTSQTKKFNEKNAVNIEDRHVEPSFTLDAVLAPRNHFCYF